MYVQLDRFEDKDRVVLAPYPKGGRTFDLPATMLPDGAKPGDVFEMNLTLDAGKTREARGEAAEILEELLGGRDTTTDGKDRRDGG